jgi:glucokinase
MTGTKIPSQKVLAFDIGGTKVASAICQINDPQKSPSIHLDSKADFASSEFSNFDGVVHAWLGKNPPNLASIAAVGIGVAGPVKGTFPNQSAHVTNLGWTLSAAAISRMFDDRPVYLGNDMETHGWGVTILPESKYISISDAKPNPGSQCLIAAGTGLGESVIAWNGQELTPLPGEGGHAAFSPFDERDDRLLRFLRHKYNGHVSWERVLGGRDGFKNLALFLAEDIKSDSKWEHLSKHAQDLVHNARDLIDLGPTVISLLTTHDPFAEHLFSYYALLYGREAANLAVKCMPYAGLYIGGGIAPRIIDAMKKHFMTGFLAKGRFSEVLKGIPVRMIMDTDNGIKGAAWGCYKTRKLFA